MLIRSRGLEIGFVDAAYFNGSPRGLWRTKGLLLQQITFYNAGREGVSAYGGELPFGLRWSDDREQACAKLAGHESSRRSYLTDRWDIGLRRLVLAYRQDGGALDSVHVKLRIPPLPALPQGQPALAAGQWFSLFGLPAESPRLQAALAPLDLRAHVEDADTGEREIDCLEDGGLILYFEQAERLQLQAHAKGRSLALGAVKFHRTRDLDARQYQGELPFGLDFEDSPSMLEARIGHPAARRKDGPMTGYARWHLDGCCLQVLYSTIENHLFRVMLMAPGYWQEMGQEMAAAD
ncbi:MAG: hypothetical protein QM750_12375 [Rubrivivax sp.]